MSRLIHHAKQILNSVMVVHHFRGLYHVTRCCKGLNDKKVGTDQYLLT